VTFQVPAKWDGKQVLSIPFISEAQEGGGMLNRSSSSRCPILELVEADAKVGDELQAKHEAAAAVDATKARRPNSSDGSSSDNA